jgi:hypothetical protein
LVLVFLISSNHRFYLLSAGPIFGVHLIPNFVSSLRFFISPLTPRVNRVTDLLSSLTVLVSPFAQSVSELTGSVTALTLGVRSLSDRVAALMRQGSRLKIFITQETLLSREIIADLFDFSTADGKGNSEGI